MFILWIDLNTYGHGFSCDYYFGLIALQNEIWNKDFEELINSNKRVSRGE